MARLDVEGRYDAFLVRQDADLKAFAADEEMLLHEGIDYQDVEGLSSEVRERLGKVRPASIVSDFCFFQNVNHSC
jgi:tRNA uridine 5-carboxymethylaminomethyl modification enzyme